MLNNELGSPDCVRLVREIQATKLRNGGYLSLGYWLRDLPHIDLQLLLAMQEEITPETLITNVFSHVDALVLTMALMCGEGEDVTLSLTAEVNDNYHYLFKVLLPIEELARSDMVTVDYAQLTFDHELNDRVITEVRHHA